jgi:hypothetical protein
MDRPKLKLILFRICPCAVIIWLLAVGIWEYRIDNHFDAIFFPVLALVITWQTIKSWKKTNWGWVAGLAFWIVFASCFTLRREYRNHQGKLLLDKFGPVLNARRVKLGIPVIPVNWQADYDQDWTAVWSKKDSAIGHQNKRVLLDSLHRLDFEEDTYKLKDADSVSRYVNIRANFSKSGTVNSIEYWCEIGMNNKTLSRTQADSIFKAEKIRKDY